MKNIKNRSIVDFDITPLLDVIFIVLMVVMSHQVVNSNISDKEFVTVQEQLDETVAENELHKTQLYAYENADNLVAYVTLRADYEIGNPKTRNIQFTYNNDISYIEITITPDNEEESYKLLEEKLIEFLSNNSEIPVLLVLNEDQILYRDQVTISEMLKNLRDQYTNLYQTEKQEQK